jgi:hypothetical protein
VKRPYATVRSTVLVQIRVTVYKWDPGALVPEVKRNVNLQNGAVAKAQYLAVYDYFQLVHFFSGLGS